VTKPRGRGAGRRRAVRDAWGRLGLHVPVRRVVEELARHGVEVSEALVTAVRIEILKEVGRRRGVNGGSVGNCPRAGTWRPQKRPPRRGRG
jgi:hypothetical protein